MFLNKMLHDNYFIYYVFILLELKPAKIGYLKIWDHVKWN